MLYLTSSGANGNMFTTSRHEPRYPRTPRPITRHPPKTPRSPRRTLSAINMIDCGPMNGPHRDGR
jgi:hypothetical protein